MSATDSTPPPHAHEALDLIGPETVHPQLPTPNAKALAALSLGALGVVYGDIGTSPLYAIRECFLHEVPSEAGVLGVVSLIFWSLTLVIVVKYLSFVLRADNHGEGGILALLALAEPQKHKGALRWTLLMTGLVGSALLFADGIITPAISVLSAVEGIEVAAPAAHEFVIPIAIGILVALFSVQRSGTGQLGAFFGPIVLVWFMSIASVALPWIVKHPDVLRAINPSYGIAYLAHGGSGFLVLGSVVLCVTGGEALYADLGHFGRTPIRYAWYLVVFPCLLLSYFGQGAYLLAHTGAPIGNPFYEMVPEALRYPMIGLATMATAIASQALITGIFAMVQQAVQLGYLPRVSIVHTSKDIEGRIYIPQANFILMALCITLVIGFQNSSALASAYGIAVCGTMALTSTLFFFSMKKKWGVGRVAALTALFLVFDLAFLGANVHKIAHGGWVPLAVAVVFVSLMTSWQRGTRMVSEQLASLQIPLVSFIEKLEDRGIARVPGTAVFLTREAHGTPPMLVHYVDHSLALQEHLILLTVQVDHVPRVLDSARVDVEQVGHGFYRVRARYGFMESPDLGLVLLECEKRGVPIHIQDSTIFVGHSTVLTTGQSRMARWRKSVFEILNRNARPASTYYRLPSTRVMEIGVRIEI